MRLPVCPLADLPTDLAARPANLTEITEQQERLLDGHFLHVVRDAVRLPDGTHATREYVQHPGAVVIVACLDDARVIVEYQYRHPMQRAMIEFPAGKREAGEPALRCAQRELREETGFIAREWACAGTMHNCIAYSDEHIDIWFARGLQFVGQHLDAGEFLQVYTATLPDLLQRARNGILTDAKTLTALLWLQQTHSGAWALDWQAVDATVGF